MNEWQMGYNLGLLLKPHKGTRIGLAYRSQVNMYFRGEADLNHLGNAYIKLGAHNTSAKTWIPLARSIIVSASQDITPKLALLFEAGWQNWGAMKYTTISLGTGGSVTINRDWKDTYRLGMGMRYRLFKPLVWQGGFSFDSDPASLQNRTPDMPMDQNWRYATGLEYELNKNMTLNLNWEFVDLGNAPIDKQALPVTVQPFKRRRPITVFNGRQFRGDYNQYINLIGLSFRWKFGKAPESKTEVKVQPSPASVAKVPR
jgi:long-chain fatty acid transport protein